MLYVIRMWTTICNPTTPITGLSITLITKAMVAYLKFLRLSNLDPQALHLLWSQGGETKHQDIQLLALFREEIHFLICSPPPFSNRREKQKLQRREWATKGKSSLLQKEKLEQLEAEVTRRVELCTLSRHLKPNIIHRRTCPHKGDCKPSKSVS